MPNQHVCLRDEPDAEHGHALVFSTPSFLHTGRHAAFCSFSLLSAKPLDHALGPCSTTDNFTYSKLLKSEKLDGLLHHPEMLATQAACRRQWRRAAAVNAFTSIVRINYKPSTAVPLGGLCGHRWRRRASSINW
ncbi:unnamed protein product [Protopolystoma xenopodis]|uniref:Uncharacterized protein n=1 Tax=Protopolystoma xenopodis TaxID=117903 RepID=A0A3S5BXK2_9PLAT|nr:unnamed protein product [Protopolystoma xenopodis]